MNKLLYCALLIVFPCLFSSCTSSILGGKKTKNGDTAKQGKDKVAVAATPQPAPVITGAPVPTMPGNTALVNALAPLWNKRLSYKTLSGKAKISLEGPDLSHELVANFRIAKDSVVWVHVTALGGIVSVARIFVTQDSFFMLNYQQKEATRLPLSEVVKILPVPVRFHQLQNLFSGDPLAGGALISAIVKDSTWSLHTEDSTYLQDITYAKADSAMAVSYLQTRAPNGPTALTDYHNYEAVGNRKISTNRMVHIQNGLKNYTIDMNINNPEFDKVLEFPFTIPGNYTMKNK